ncbi:MAG: hypothetical protein L0Y72_07055 [Gemmataceae bacterium]|nr:hypothetical protein [Gemmataceae bacterium]MCI0738784.1 hypothetical protein [Gemmataceae bacterium]
MQARHRIMCWIVMATAAIAGTVQGQDPQDRELAFWGVRQRQQAGAAAQLITAHNPLTAATLRWAAHEKFIWNELEFVADTAPALDPKWLEFVRDGTPMPDLRGKAPDEIRKDQLAAYKSFNEAVIKSFRVPFDAFAKSAQENSHVTFAHLWNKPDDYRGKVVALEGKLVRVRRWEATQEAQAEGVKYVYEGWVFGPTRKAPPYWIVFTVLPDGLKESEKMDRYVTFYGYFLKKVKYKSESGDRDTPLLVGPSVMLTKAPDTDEGSSTAFPIEMLFGAVALVAIVTVGFLVLSWYLRRGDRALELKLKEMQLERAKEMMENVGEETPTGPGAPPGAV